MGFFRLVWRILEGIRRTLHLLLLLVIFGFLTFCNTLVLHAVKLRLQPRLFTSEKDRATCKIAS